MTLRLLVTLIATIALVTASGALATETETTTDSQTKQQTTADGQATTQPTDSADSPMDSKTEAGAPAGPGPSVDRDKVTTGLIDREPQDEVTQLGNDKSQVYYFTEVHGKPGDRVTHRWEYEGQLMAEVPFEIGSSRWRTYSSKELMPTWLGEWTVTAVDASGRVLSQKTFEVVPSQQMVPAAAAPEGLE